jgi:hypothetical protein
VEARRNAAILVQELGTTGVNVFQNNGRASGQTRTPLPRACVPRHVDSDPARRLRETEFEHTRHEELRMLAAALLAPRSAG